MIEMVEPEIFQLDNHIRVIHKQTDSIVSHLGVMFKAGSKFEQEGKMGLAHFLEHCVFKGTKNRRAFHILSRLDSVGGELNAYTTKEEICVYGTFTEEHLERAVELLADILFNSTFPAKEIEKEKAVVIDEINSYLDSPSDQIFDDFESYLYPNHTLGNNILGTEESVLSFTKEDLRDYLEQLLYPENMVISYVGKHSPKRILKKLNKYFGEFKRSANRIMIPKPKEIQPFHLIIPESNYQTHIMIGGIAPSYFDDDRAAFSLLTNVLGGPALNSKLVLAVREKYGYTYNVESNYNAFEETGYWNIYASTDAAYQKKTTQLIYKELKSFMETPLSSSQLIKAKQQLKGQLALSMEYNSNVMLNYAKSLLIYGKIDTLMETYQKIDKITRKEIQDAAVKYFDPKKISELLFVTR